MEYNSYLQQCNNEDLLELSSEMCKIGKFKKAIESAFDYQLADAIIKVLDSQGIRGAVIMAKDSSRKYGYTPRNSLWFSDGKDCKILKIGANGWQKGNMRIKVTVEFCPDEPEVIETPASNQQEINQPESPLDDIRRMINQESQQ